MKRAALLLLLLPAISSQAQVSTRVDMDINNIRMVHLVHGDMWWDPLMQAPSGEYPRGSGREFSSGGSLWMAGYDPQSVLHVSAQTYRQAGNDYWPGPLDTAADPIQKLAHANKWGHIWKLNRTTLDSFRALSSHTLQNTPETILQWPAKGNPYAAGRNKVPLTVTTDMAPFVDVNQDGQYNPLDGDYPAMKGDQMLWWIVNDKGVDHSNTNALPFTLEVRHTAWAYKRNTIADDIIFYEFALTNKAAIPYNMRFGFASDMDLGQFDDDYAGFDSVRRMGIYYNGNTLEPKPA